MSKSSIFCIALSRGRAGRIVLNLKEAGFSNKEISALFLDQSGMVLLADPREPSAPVDEVQVWPSGIMYGVMAWIAAVGFRIIPGETPIIAAGPIVAALGEETADGFSDGLADYGVPREKAWSYERNVRDGYIFLSVEADGPVAGERARAIFKSAGGHEICATRDTPQRRTNATSTY